MATQTPVRRITVTKRANGEYGYKVQGGNWRTIEAAEEGFKQEATVLRRLLRKYPDAQELVRADGTKLLIGTNEFAALVKKYA